MGSKRVWIAVAYGNDYGFFGPVIGKTCNDALNKLSKICGYKDVSPTQFIMKAQDDGIDVDVARRTV